MDLNYIFIQTDYKLLVKLYLCIKITVLNSVKIIYLNLNCNSANKYYAIEKSKKKITESKKNLYTHRYKIIYWAFGKQLKMESR